MTELRVPPQNIEAEVSVLSAMFIDPEAIETAIERINEDYFYKTANRLLYRAIVEAYKNGRTIDLISVVELLKEQGKYDQAGGIGYLTDVINAEPSAVNINGHIDILEQKALQRELIKKSSELIELAYSGNGDVYELIGRAENEFYKIGEKRVGNEIKHIGSFTDSVANNYKKYTETEFQTGVNLFIDQRIRLFRGMPFIFAGLPGAGKSSFIMNALLNIARGVPVGFFSQEMSGEMVNMRSGHTLGAYDQNGFERYQSGAQKLNELKFYIDETPGLTEYQLRAKTLRMVKKFGVQVIALDYIQLANGEGRTIFEKETNVSKAIKNLAKETNTCWLIISQMKKESYRQKRRNMGDVKGSGQIIQDARGIYFLEESESQNNSSDKSLIDFWCAKQNFGPAGWTEKLFFDKKNNKFTRADLTEETGWGY